MVQVRSENTKQFAKTNGNNSDLPLPLQLSHPNAHTQLSPCNSFIGSFRWLPVLSKL